METKKLKIYCEWNHVLELTSDTDCIERFLSWLKYGAYQSLFVFDSDSSSHTFVVCRDKVVAVKIFSQES